MRFPLRAAMIPATAFLLLAACGGGGGGSSNPSPPPPPPVNTTPPTASISAITPAQRVTNQPVSFTGSGTTAAGGALSYAWNFGDGTTATGVSTTHNYTTHGNFTVTLRVTDSGGLATNATQAITLVAPPSTPTIVIAGGSNTPNTPVSFTASATDPQGNALTYAWDFGDGTTGTGAAPTHTYTAPGTFQARVTATNSESLTSTSAASPVAIAWLLPVRPTLIILNDGHFVGQTLFAGAAFLEPNGLPYVLEWSFGDSATASSTNTYAMVPHTYAAAGTYTVRVTATSAAGQVVSVLRTVNVQLAPALSATFDNVLHPYCAGSFCAATDATNYSGHGIGVWRYHNSTNAPATINLAINGLHEGVAASLVFSSGKSTAAASAPGPGTAIVPANKLRNPAADNAAAYAHAQVQAANRRQAESIKRISVAPSVNKQTRQVFRAAAPPVGTTRTWREFAFTGRTFNLKVAATCAFSTGRNGVIWIDADQLQSGGLNPARADALAATLCGPNGAYERLVALVGDVWGPDAASTPGYIQDTPALQDLHIVIPAVSQDQQWNGYFASSNLGNATVDPTANAALAVVLNGYVFANYPETDGSTRNTLIHELKHLANYYQRVIRRGAYHSTFLEETSAMLAEDLIAPLTTPESRTDARVGGYAFGGAGVGYIGWTHPDGGSYNVGGTFGTFLHRRYGSSLDRELITMCSDNGLPQSSYDCVNQYIIRHGGLGFEDEFARMGASTLGMMSSTQLPAGFGLPGMLVDNVPLKPIGSYRADSPFNSPPADLGGNFGATTQTFQHDYMKPGQTTFRRDNVVVPANTTLMIVVSEQPSF